MYISHLGETYILCSDGLHPERVGSAVDTVLPIHVRHLHQKGSVVAEHCEVLAEHNAHAGVGQGRLTHLTQIEPGDGFED